MPAKKKRVWSEKENNRLMKKYGKDLKELGEKVNALIETEGSSPLDLCPDLLLFYKKVTLGGGDLEKTFALSCVMVAGMHMGKIISDVLNAEKEEEGVPPKIEGGSGGMKN